MKRRFFASAMLSFSLAGCGGGPTARFTPVDTKPVAPNAGVSILDASSRIPGRTIPVTGARNASGTCAFPSVVVQNHSPNPKIIDVDSLDFVLACTPTATLLGVSAYQSNPLLSPVKSLKLGDLTIANGRATFAAKVTTFSLAPNSTTTVAIVSESSTAAVALPVTPGVPNLLTSNAPNIPQIVLTYAQGTGASVYGSSCFPAFDRNGTLAKELQTQQLLGTPKVYCVFDTPNGAVTFGAAPRFDVDFSKFDAGLLLLDGPIRTDQCVVAATSESCTTTTFTAGTGPTDFQRAIVGNVADPKVCAPVIESNATNNFDCNATTNPTPQRTSLPGWNQIQILVSNDPTYVGPAFGGYQLSVPPGSACVIDTGADNAQQFPDYPAGYYDPQAISDPSTSAAATSFLATYPADLHAGSAEFEIDTLSTGTCTVNIAETTGLKRKIPFTIPVL